MSSEYFKAPSVREILPSGNQVLRNGAAGAMLASALTAITDVPRVRAGTVSRERALSHALRNAAVGAGAGVLAGAAAHLARRHPVAGVVTMLAAGAGAVYLAARSLPQAAAEVTDEAMPGEVPGETPGETPEATAEGETGDKTAASEPEEPAAETPRRNRRTTRTAAKAAAGSDD